MAIRDTQDFAWMLRQLKQGYKIKRKSWGYGIFKKKDENSILCDLDSLFWYPEQSDIFAEDWERCKKNQIK